MPGGVPLLGHVNEFRSRPLDLVLRGLDTGDIVEARLGPRRCWFINHPDLIREVLVTRRELFTKQTRGYRTLRLVLGDGLVTSEGDLWRRQRRIAQPVFLRKSIAGFAETMASCTADLASVWRAQPGGTFDVAGDMMQLTLRIAGLTLISQEFGDSSGPIAEAVTAVLESFTRLATSALPYPERWPFPSNRRFARAEKLLDTLVRDIIAERRAAREATGELESAADLMDLLMAARDPETGEGMSDDLLRDELLTALAAGHETTANALVWTLHLLSIHPEVQTRVADEIKSHLGDKPADAKSVMQLTYTSQVFQEALRLYPPVWLFGRQTSEALELGGVQLPGQSLVFISAWALHHDPRWWQDPERFDPDRWQPERLRAAKEAGRPKLAYIPFSAGQRKCIGDHFAKLEAMIVLAGLLGEFEVQPTRDVVTPEPQLTLRPLGGLPLKIVPR